MHKYHQGYVISWESQSAGTTTRKFGAILGICIKGMDAEAMLRELGLDPDRLKVMALFVNSVDDRYIVQVDQPPTKAGRVQSPKIYLPACSLIDKVAQVAAYPNA